MATINANYDKLQSSYLFSEIAKRTKAFMEENPGVQILRLGIGNTTEALTATVIEGLIKGVKKLADTKTYTGYGDEQGDIRLRKELVTFYKKRGIFLDTQEIFVSDGAKSDSANISSIFGTESIVAVADPVYPVYLDSNVISGKKVVYMECSEDEGFIPNPPKGKVDLIFICSPNNPTGAVATKRKLRVFVEYALKNKAVIVFDAAYSEYISDKSLPKSIYEIKGAKGCAIEINSFSKWAGFTGVRLGWTVVPIELIVEGTERGKVNSLWNRRQATMFNGASNIVQEGGLAVLSAKGRKECNKLINYYMNNAKIIKKGLGKLGLKVFGGENAPYIWLKTPREVSSWDFFDKLLEEAYVVGTPGSGFGRAGEGYFRLSAFGHKEDIERAVKSIQNNLKL
ncbi:LL-diaminopimelate aminotransferase [Candidatus Daviesbacteria bacterium RIFCSPHIGHO2_01_FULL_40_11]|uniref:LL-diaminopimelate aminotransferase n=1 Tax=Candidatus Daviesbacteria bacterium RIFCSPHIGHO2_01_FULL_40_11 TaxID=1797762 RepID=A0A1F5JFE9_9BACT|nr:MAG: LL-diaminopimelate aminotransferase [Candidatus Daviesbacteria bacterium RIFCSPHIGHO2_01_FULL_40_11]OGE62686.1 MAG: LL-diaminopimelate aminotransferase [Candidatus Daviesbacteria bacterium RIFCSPLOWO2_01_FULL_40_27]